jgi:hypothetical protein
MKKHTLILTVVAAALLGGALVFGQTTPSPSPSGSPIVNRDCIHQSQNTELYGFCGDKALMLKKIDALPVQLSERRVFVQITQGSSGGEVKYYERQEDGTFAVTQWDLADTFDLLATIDQSVFESKGLKCVGDQVKNVLIEKLGSGKAGHPLASSPSLNDAFAGSVNNASGKFIRTTMVILC